MGDNKNWRMKEKEELAGLQQQAVEHFPFLNAAAELKAKADCFKALGDETRLKIIGLLWFEDLCMCEIVSGLSGATSTVSHHLKIMEKGKVIKSKREGKFTIYSLERERLLPLLPYIKEGDFDV